MSKRNILLGNLVLPVAAAQQGIGPISECAHPQSIYTSGLENKYPVWAAKREESAPMMASGVQSFPLDSADLAESSDEGQSSLSDFQLSLSLSGCGFQLQLPLQPLRRRGAWPCHNNGLHGVVQLHGTTCSASEAAPAEVMKLQELLVGQDRGLLKRLEETGEAPDVHFLQRWLLAKGSVAAAAAAILAHVEWRVQFMGSAAAAAAGTGPVAPSGEGKVFLQGANDQGQPILIVRAGQHVLTSADLPQTQQLICAALDHATLLADPAQNPLAKVCCLFDLAGLTLGSLDAKALGAIFELLQEHYPERLARLYFLNAPWLFWGVWRLVSPFLASDTREKIAFLSSRGLTEALQGTVAPSVLPPEYGGTGVLVPLEEAVAAARRSAAARAAAVSGSRGGQQAGAGGGAGGNDSGREQVRGGPWRGVRARLEGARRGLGAGARSAGGAAAALAVRAGRVAKGGAEAAAGAAGAALGRLRSAQKSGRLAAVASALPACWRELLVPTLLLSVLRGAARALVWAKERMQVQQAQQAQQGRLGLAAEGCRCGYVSGGDEMAVLP